MKSLSVAGKFAAQKRERSVLKDPKKGRIAVVRVRQLLNFYSADLKETAQSG